MKAKERTAMMKFIMSVLLVTLMSGPASAGYNTLGLGVTSCVHLGKEYRKAPTITRMMYYTWFAGFASGVNSMVDRTKDLRVNADTRWAQLSRWCDQHPLAYFRDAVMQVINDLPYEDERSSSRD